MTADRQASSTAEAGTDGKGLSQFIASVLGQLSLSAWLPSALLTMTLAVFVAFRHNKSMDLVKAIQTLTDDKSTILILTIPVLVGATLITQAFSFEAIRMLEGYWHRGGPASWLRAWCIRYHAARKTRLHKKRIEASGVAFQVARIQLRTNSIPVDVVDALELAALEQDIPELSEEHREMFDNMQWSAMCNPVQMARVEHLHYAEEEYPSNSRILPTVLGNVIRTGEEGIANAGEDLEGFALRAPTDVSPRILQQHDQFRARLDMYCVLVFVSIALAVANPAITWGTTGPDRTWQIVGISVGFALLAWASYRAAIASARGYIVALRQMDAAVGEDDESATEDADLGELPGAGADEQRHA